MGWNRPWNWRDRFSLIHGTFKWQRSNMVDFPVVLEVVLAVAEDRLRAAGINYTVSPKPSFIWNIGIVYSSQIAAGTSVAVGSSVVIKVSTGAIIPNITWPAADGASEAAALAKLGGLSLVGNNAGSATSPTVPLGAIVSQDPAAASITEPGVTVDYIVSLGP